MMDKESEGEGGMPWAAYNAFFKYVKERDEKNFFARCKLCLPTISDCACSYTSSANLKSHLKRKHSWSDKQVEALNVTVSTSKASKRQRDSDGTFGAEGGESAEGDHALKRRIRQQDIDDAVDRLVINETLPHRIVDSPYFKKAVLLGLPSRFNVGCRQTLSQRLKKHFETMKTNLIKELSSASYVALFADCWSKFRRSFLGMTVTWLDPDSMERKFATLALKRLKQRHTFDRLAVEMKKVQDDYQISSDKTVKCTTDSASNFAKAFRIFQLDKRTNEGRFSEPEAHDNGDDSENVSDVSVESKIEESDREIGEDVDDNCVAVSIDELCEGQVGQNGIILPPHQRCASHILNLIAVKDGLKALLRNGPYKKIHDSTEEKLKTYWNRQQRSDLVATTIHDGLGVKFEVPGDTRWNSEFDAKRQITKLQEEKSDKLAETLEAAGLPKLLPAESRFLREYVWVMEPVAFALDLLQRDKDMYLGYLLPTILGMERTLKVRTKMDGKPLKYCQVLIDTLLTAIREPRRFGDYLKDEELDLHVAATLLPCFKTTWIEDRTDLDDDAKEKLMRGIKAKILREMTPLSPAPDEIGQTSTLEATRAEAQDEEALAEEAEETVDDPGEVDVSMEDAFFGFGKSRSQLSDTDEVEGPEEELERYLLNTRKSSTKTVASCYAKANGRRNFPRLCQLFARYNVALPSSASVERLFSRSGHSFSATRNVLGDETLQREVLLRVNSQYWS